MPLKSLPTLLYHSVAWFLLLLLFSCHVHVDAPIDNRQIFLGVYHAEETFYNPASGFYETVVFDFEVVPVGAQSIELLPLSPNGFYGTPCSLVGDVFQAGVVEFPVNICSPDPFNTYEFSGVGSISRDGQHLHIDWYIDYCTAGGCVPEPEVYVDAWRI